MNAAPEIKNPGTEFESFEIESPETKLIVESLYITPKDTLSTMDICIEETPQSTPQAPVGVHIHLNVEEVKCLISFLQKQVDRAEAAKSRAEAGNYPTVVKSYMHLNSVINWFRENNLPNTAKYFESVRNDKVVTKGWIEKSFITRHLGEGRLMQRLESNCATLVTVPTALTQENF